MAVFTLLDIALIGYWIASYNLGYNLVQEASFYCSISGKNTASPLYSCVEHPAVLAEKADLAFLGGVFPVRSYLWTWLSANKTGAAALKRIAARAFCRR